jgi:glutamate synthase domain-containing protein 2/glutamate synthase domain-containing protein 1/glutamate synthase domain-containing protein 3
VPHFGPASERDACGIGFVADSRGRASREIVECLLEGLHNVRHRGATAADRKTGDGAGVLLPLPPDGPRWLGRGVAASAGDASGLGLAMVFLRDEAARDALEVACRAEGLEPLGWREVPVEADALGEAALATMPRIEQLLLRRPESGDAEQRAFRARRRAERLVRAVGAHEAFGTGGAGLAGGASSTPGAYIASLSFRTVTYKALCAAEQLAHFYPDLREPGLVVPFGIFHQRFSTNTTPSWERAQPFRLLCHNGEINAIQGNVNWMRAREGNFGSEDDELLHPVIDESGSDSAMLDNALELLVRHGRDVRNALTMLVPEAWEANGELDPLVRDYYRYHSLLVEPWDGPAGLVFTDGRVVGAALDRNGLRPLRYAACADGLVVCCSEAGAVDLSGRGGVRRGRLGPGQMIAVDPERGLEENEAIKRRLAERRPYGRWLAAGLRPGTNGTPAEPSGDDLTARQSVFGYTREDLNVILRPVAGRGHEPTSSMGDDTALPPLAGRARPLYSYFRQRFAQVTNPPIDHLRERHSFSLRTILGGRATLLTEGPETARGTELESFFLYPDALDAFDYTRLDATFDADLRGACVRLADEAEARVRAGRTALVVSDSGGGRAPVPMLMAVAAVHHRLVSRGLRTLATLVADTNEAREAHHLACLLGYGAEAICPRLALETVAALAAADKVGGDRPPPAEAQRRFRAAVEDAVLKIMSKMGIADVAAYCGAQVFDIVGLAPEVVKLCFPGTPSPVGGIGFDELEREALGRAAATRLESPGYVKFRKGGEPHETDTAVVDAAHALRLAVRTDRRDRYERFAELVDGRPPMELRDLLELVPAGESVPLDEFEPAEAIVQRFSAGGMSHGALSAEAHETIAIAFNNLRARSNCGEGGEDPVRFRTERNSRIKQVASGRFGVTPEYAAFADELQIKIAQGSKPGEGGQLPGHKVTVEIARLRHTQPGVALISPPPHHDIYSIEDLAQLIFDLRQVNPTATISVKLVSESGVGLVASGVVKAHADVVHIAGCDGGTGASPLSSIKNAGLPWELGLAETQRSLVESGLRARARLRADGGIKTGRDVVVAALLGADEISFGTALLLAEGCMMVRSCHLDTCPVGIATQRPELRAKYAATPEQVEAYLLFVAGHARELLAALGLRSFAEAVGRTDLLRRRSTGDPRADVLDLGPLLAAPRGSYAGEEMPVAGGGGLGERLARDAGRALEGPALVEPVYAISTWDRAVGARLGGEIGRRFGADPPPGRIRARFTGSAGQSFGAFLAAGVALELVGEANDYVGKSMGGGRIAIRAPEKDAGDPVLVGNTVLYGATGGELYCAGRAGERFAVRNSGAVAVVEGIGDHGCEYMTNGTVVVLGEVGRNFGAGMSGGEAYVYDPAGTLQIRLNDDLVGLARVHADTELRYLVERHVRYTGSELAAALLEVWDQALGDFWHVSPKAEVASIEEEHEGTGTGAVQETEEATAG